MRREVIYHLGLLGAVIVTGVVTLGFIIVVDELFAPSGPVLVILVLLPIFLVYPFALSVPIAYVIRATVRDTGYKFESNSLYDRYVDPTPTTVTEGSRAVTIDYSRRFRSETWWRV
jgi:hypothetical protein